MKMKDIIAGILFLAFLLWFLGSWFEVQLAAATDWHHTYCPANMFVLIGEVMK